MPYFTSEKPAPRESTLAFIRAFARNYRCLTLDDGENIDFILG